MFIVYYGMIGKTNIPKQIVNMLFVILTGHDNLDDKTIIYNEQMTMSSFILKNFNKTSKTISYLVFTFFSFVIFINVIEKKSL